MIHPNKKSAHLVAFNRLKQERLGIDKRALTYTPEWVEEQIASGNQLVLDMNGKSGCFLRHFCALFHHLLQGNKREASQEKYPKNRPSRTANASQSVSLLVMTVRSTPDERHVFVQSNPRARFTDAEDDYLAHFIAQHCPTMKCRHNQTIFQSLANPILFPWAVGHGWIGWKRRYARQTEYFDPMIVKILEQHPEWKSVKATQHKVSSCFFFRNIAGV